MIEFYLNINGLRLAGFLIYKGQATRKEEAKK
jgi:hypothetical protein